MKSREQQEQVGRQGGGDCSQVARAAARKGSTATKKGANRERENGEVWAFAISETSVPRPENAVEP